MERNGLDTSRRGFDQGSLHYAGNETGVKLTALATGPRRFISSEILLRSSCHNRVLISNTNGTIKNHTIWTSRPSKSFQSSDNRDAITMSKEIPYLFELGHPPE